MEGGKMDSQQALESFERLVPGFGLNRDPERTPMQWDVSSNAGFTSGKPWLPVAPDASARNVAVERKDNGAILHLYRRLIALRKQQSAIALGGYTTLRTTGDVLAYRRSYADERVVVVLNFSDQVQTCRLPEITSGRVLLSTRLDRNGHLTNDYLTLDPNEGVVILTQQSR
jgi:alpha-glucosidase